MGGTPARRPLLGGSDMEAVTTDALLGRDRELGRLDRLCGAAGSGRGTALVVVGEAGIGKTAFLRAASTHASVPAVWISGSEKGADAVALAATETSGGPVLLVVDDADALYPAALAALADVASPSRELGAVVVFAVRPGGPGEAVLAGLEQLRLDGLPPRLARVLLADAAAGPLDPAVADQLVAATDANPLALRELAATLSTDQLAGRQPLPRPLPVGDRLDGYYRTRVRDLSGRVRRALLVVAASFGSPNVVAEGLARLGLSPADLEDAERTGLVSRVGDRVELRPPLVRPALYHAAPAEELRAVHAALAEANAAAGREDRRAWHLARAASGADEATAALIEAAARAHRRRGEASDAATGFEAAARLSGDPTRAADRAVSAAETWMVAGCIGLARSMSEQALAGPVPERTRARAALVRGRALLVGGDEAEGRRYLSEQAGVYGATDPDLAMVMAVTVSAAALRAGQVGEALAAAQEAVGWAHAPRSGSDNRPDGAAADMALAAALVAGGDAAARAGLVDAALADLAGPRVLLTECPIVLIAAATALVWAEDHRGARAVLERLEAAARPLRLAAVLSQALCVRALLEHRSNQWREAEAAASEALELARSTGQAAVVPYAAAMLATAESVLGRADSCRERCLALLDTPAMGVPLLRSAVLSALGLLELGEGRPDQAVRWYEVLAGSGGSPGRSNPGIVMWGADLAEAYLDAGYPGKAQVVADQLEERARALGNARAGAAIRRVRAGLCPDDEEAEVLFAEALRLYGGPEWRFARGRIELARGRRLAAAGRRSDAERRLSRSLGLFRELGAEGWARRAAGELRRLGVSAPGGPDPTAVLTPLERQVAMTSALGGTTADIAAGLFLAESAVAAALDSAATKLGVAPHGLAARLSELTPGSWAGPAAPPAGGPDPAPARADARDAPQRVRVLGDCDVSTDSSTIPCPPGPGGYLVKRLALADRLPVEELVEELWPEAPPGAGRNRLRTALTRLRRSVGPVVVRDGGWLALAPGVEVDAKRFEATADAAEAAAAAGEPNAGTLARQALGIYGGELLPIDRHLSFTAGPRERLRRRYLAMVGLVVEDTAARGNADAAVAMLEAAISDNPLEERLYVRAASLLAEAGRSAQAAAMLRRARAALAELELPLSPDAEELLARLR